MKPTVKVLIALALGLCLSACGHINNSHHYSSSAVNYLYPDQQHALAKQGIPELDLPIKVGIAFVPESSTSEENGSVLTAAEKMGLMRQVQEHFQAYKFVHSLKLIPSNYLYREGGFDNLRQIKAMHDIDAIALISYDQNQFTEEGFASISYWTIVGAYLVPGEHNDTHTMVDASVYHIESETLLFRAPGINHIKSKATPINLSAQLRLDSNRGFKQASSNLIIKLDQQLQQFRRMAKTSPDKIQLNYSEAYTGY